MSRHASSSASTVLIISCSTYYEISPPHPPCLNHLQQASGNLGPSILSEFLKSHLTVSVLSRPSSTATFPPEVNVIKSSYEPSELVPALKGQDAVISLVGAAAFDEQQKLIDAAIAAGVKRFVPSEFGSNTADQKAREFVPIFGTKKEVVDYLVGKEGEISWTGVITGPFFDWVSDARLLSPMRPESPPGAPASCSA